MPEVDADDQELVYYNYRPERSDWDAWKATVPRHVSLHDRLDQLRALDRQYDLDALTDESDASEQPLSADALEEAIRSCEIDNDDYRLALVRIRRRCMTALPDARENDADRAGDELTEIQNIVQELLDE